MKLSDFDYHLPKELIAQTPVEPRDHSKLLILDRKTKELKDKYFYDILDELWENDVLVLNKTKVINARLHFVLENWKIWEILLHKQIWEKTWDCLVYPGKKLKPWKVINIGTGTPQDEGIPVPKLTAEIKEISQNWRIIEFNIWWIEFLKILEKIWEVPLPPYIKEKLNDPDRYQTIWAEKEGSAAAPTASLHFTNELLEKLQNSGVKIEKVLLHVGLWTFMPVSSENIEEHHMHSEYIELEKDVAERLNQYKKAKKRIVAVWTTTIRVLESFAWEDWILNYGSKETDIFIYPGYKWKFVDAMITNFHLPKSTLLMLVSSFAWKDLIEKAYKHAIENKYRFFSFGDAMFIK